MEIKKITASQYPLLKKCAMSAWYDENTGDIMSPGLFKKEAFAGQTLHKIAEKLFTLGVSEIAVEERFCRDELTQSGAANPGTQNFDLAVAAILFYVRYLRYVKEKRQVQSSQYPPHVAIEKKSIIEIDGIKLVVKADAAIFSPDLSRIDIFDLKTGAHDYSDTGRDQLYFSFLVLLAEMKTYTFHNFSTQNISGRTHIVQPRYWKDTEWVKTWMEEPRDIRDIIQPILDNARSRKFCPGDHCVMCSGFLMCAHIQDSIERILKIQTLPEQRTLSKEAIVYILSKKRETMKYFEGLDNLVIRAITAGQVFPGVTMKPATAKRKAMLLIQGDVPESVRNIFENLD